MADFFGVANFPGIETILSAQITLSHGITPSVAQLEILPQERFIGEGGRLVFYDLNSPGTEGINFYDCKLDLASYRNDQSGRTWTLSIFDRRWKWKAGAGTKGPLSGAYNVKNADGTFDRLQIRTPRALAVLCLEAMGEVDYDVSQLENDLLTPGPEVDWQHEYGSKALAGLCDVLGFRVVLRLDNTVAICKTGFGADLPRHGIEDESLTINPPERPDSIMVVTGAPRFQADFMIRAVGEDLNGSIVPINFLSYKPKGGWGQEGLPDFPNVGNTFRGLFMPVIPGFPKLSVVVAVKLAKELAKKTVFRYYQIFDMNPDGSVPFVLPGYPGPIVEMPNQLCPIDDLQVETQLDPTTKNQLSKPAVVWGTFFRGDFTIKNCAPPRVLPKAAPVPQGPQWLNSRGDTIYTKPFTILKDLGIVVFADYVFAYDPDGLAKNPPQYLKVGAMLGLRTACTPRDSKTWQYIRYERILVYPDGAWGTGSQVLRHEEIVPTSFPTYDPKTYKPVKITTNLDKVNREADHYLAAADLEYTTKLPQEITYSGLRRINLDGALQQITFSVSDKGAYTKVARNNEYNPAIPSYQQRRQTEQLRDDVIAELVGAVKLRDKFKVQGRGHK